MAGLIVYLILAHLALLLIVFFFISKFRRLKRTFNYRITDLYVVTLCLSPSCLEISAAWRLPETGSLLYLAVSSFIGTLAGLIVGRIHIEFPTYGGAKNAYESAVSIFTGAFIGFMFFPFPFAGIALPLSFLLPKAFS